MARSEKHRAICCLRIMIRKDTLTTELKRLIAEKHYQDALGVCRVLLDYYPEDIQAWIARAYVHLQLHEFDESIDSCRRGLLLDKAQNFLVMIYKNLGVAYLRSGRVSEATDIFQKLITINPHDAESHWNIARCLLKMGNYERGWEEHQWRFKTKGYMAEAPSHKPCWRGEPLEGKTILVMAEQGHGDTLQFVRYVADVAALGGKVILACQPDLRRLLHGCYGVAQVVTRGDVMPHFDTAIALMSLPAIFHTSLATIPAVIPYLNVPAKAGIEAMKSIAHHKSILNIGIVWTGNVNNDEDWRRSLSWEQASALLNIESARFFSLQKFLGMPVSETTKKHENISCEIIDLGPHLEDFADTAAAIQKLDLVISVDTAVAHLAGALGKPVWTLLPYVADWRWMLDRENSPWYPTMRLFRQPAPGDWSSVIMCLKTQLTALIQERSTSVLIQSH